MFVKRMKSSNLQTEFILQIFNIGGARIACYLSHKSIASTIYMPILLQHSSSEYSAQSQINKRENKVHNAYKVCTVARERYHFKLRGQEKVQFSRRQFEWDTMMKYCPMHLQSLL